MVKKVQGAERELKTNYGVLGIFSKIISKKINTIAIASAIIIKSKRVTLFLKKFEPRLLSQNVREGIGR